MHVHAYSIQPSSQAQSRSGERAMNTHRLRDTVQKPRHVLIWCIAVACTEDTFSCCRRASCLSAGLEAALSD